MISRTNEEHQRLVEHLELVSEAIRRKVSTIFKGVLIVEVANSRIQRINDDQISLKHQKRGKVPREAVEDMIEEIIYYLWQCLFQHVRFDLKIELDSGKIKDVQKTGFNKPEELVG
ncbi:MAG: hypothetical protein H0Z33_11465 [Bacillaceae bacterium]|nr:hypothetical protein [Bacillaceae bacterium]